MDVFGKDNLFDAVLRAFRVSDRINAVLGACSDVSCLIFPVDGGGFKVRYGERDMELVRNFPDMAGLTAWADSIAADPTGFVRTTHNELVESVMDALD